MTSRPSLQSAPAQTEETVEQHFRQLEAAWDAETAHLSSPRQIVDHPAFQAILGMGQDVVRFMLHDLDRGPHLWVWALPKLTGADPVPESHRGNIEKMSEDWLKWARENEIVW
jgi:hypothetical protein